jgi:hypothetical protein
VEAYIHALAKASPLVKVAAYAESHEGRKLYYVTISNAANHAKLAQIKADNAKLADPRKLATVAEADPIIASMPAIAWLAYSIHGDELSGTDASMLVAYYLTAGQDERFKKLRDELVVHIDPSQNPDGRERYLGQLQHLTGKVPNTDYQSMQHGGLWSAGRGNHYLFDLNRDWLMQVHPETRGRTAAMLEWNPHLVIDAHEMGSLDTYLFDPPREPFNVNLSEANMRWRRVFSADQAKAFDRYGWSYYTGEWYEEWYPGYTNAWANLNDAIGILYEQAGVNGASVKRPSGDIATYTDAVYHQVASSVANLESLLANRKEVLREFYQDRRWAVLPDNDRERGIFVVAPGKDPALLDRFAELLHRQGIELTRTNTAASAANVEDVFGAKQDALELPRGSLIVESSQPHRRMLRAILEFDPRMSQKFLIDERTDIESQRGSRLYDTTAWNLAMAYGLRAYWAKSVAKPNAGAKEDDATRGALPQGQPAYGYLIDGASRDVYPLLARLLESGCKVRVAQKPFKSADQSYDRGTLLLRNHENPADLEARLSEALSAGATVAARPAETALSQEGPDLGGGEFDLLELPRIAIASEWPISTTSFGSAWQLLDQRVGIRTSPVNLQSMRGVDLRRYNVLILPSAFGGGLGAVLDEGARGQLRAWVEAGGTLIAFGGSAAFIANEKNGLSSVRLRPDVLDKLEVYAEALKRERSAKDIKVDAEAVWSGRDPSPSPDKASPAAPDASKPAGGETRPVKEGETPADAAADKTATVGERPNQSNSEAEKGKEKGKEGKSKDVEALKREDAWLRMFSPNGVFVRADLDAEHWLCFGLDKTLPVLVSGSNVFMSMQPVRTPARLAEGKALRLSGLLWPEARERLENSAYATVERLGRGQIILFAADPMFRGYTEGSGRMLLNAVIFGPGLGASQPVPW